MQGALESLKPLNEAKVVSAVTSHLKAADGPERRAALYILWKGSFTNIAVAIEPLHELLAHREDLTRGMAALALGENKIVDSFDALAQITRVDGSGYARRCAAYALGRLGDSRAESVLKTALTDSDPMVAHNAKAALDMLQTIASSRPE